MITELLLVNSTSIAIDRQGNLYEVRLAGQLVGTFEISPVWALDDINKGTSLGLTLEDNCYECSGRVFILEQQAVSQLVGDYLAATDYWKMPDR